MKSFDGVKISMDLDEKIMEELLVYSDFFEGEITDFEGELFKLNMHKTISIITELIALRNSTVSILSMGTEMNVPFELKVKLMLKNCQKKEFCQMNFKDKKVHVLSLQMLLVLLKKLLVYGNYETLSDFNYSICKDDYVNIVKLQLVVAESYNEKFEKNEIDLNHFIYANLHLNDVKSVSNEFARNFYMFRILLINKENFSKEVANEYRDYNKAFYDKYGYSILEYLAVLFYEFNVYAQREPCFLFSSMWQDKMQFYSKSALREKAVKIICDHLSCNPQNFSAWAKETENNMWNFEMFNIYPFIKDSKNNVVSISEKTLENCYFENLFWEIRRCYNDKDVQEMAFYGRLFEKYIQDMVQDAVKSSVYEFVGEFSFGANNKKSSDAYIISGKNLLAIEAKGFSVLQNTILKNEDMKKNNTKLFVNPILQVDKCFTEIAKTDNVFKSIETVYIISVTMNNVKAVPEYFKNINEEIAENKINSKCKYFFNLNIEEFEYLMYLVENNHDVFKILEEYFELAKKMPFTGFLREKSDKLNMTKFIKCNYDKAAKAILELHKQI